jgi:hypothetical protein
MTLRRILIMIKLNKEGYEFISNRGIRYDLYEGVTMGGIKQYTSDAIFIMLGDERYYDEVENYLVNYIMGASFFEEDIFEFDNDIAYLVEEYENKYNLKEVSKDD